MIRLIDGGYVWFDVGFGNGEMLPALTILTSVGEPFTRVDWGGWWQVYLLPDGRVCIAPTVREMITRREASNFG